MKKIISVLLAVILLTGIMPLVMAEEIETVEAPEANAEVPAEVVDAPAEPVEAPAAPAEVPAEAPVEVPAEVPAEAPADIPAETAPSPRSGHLPLQPAPASWRCVFPVPTGAAAFSRSVSLPPFCRSPRPSSWLLRCYSTTLFPGFQPHEKSGEQQRYSPLPAVPDPPAAAAA